jgi:hypothetical protein
MCMSGQFSDECDRRCAHVSKENVSREIIRSTVCQERVSAWAWSWSQDMEPEEGVRSWCQGLVSGAGVRRCRSMCEIDLPLSGRKNDKQLFAHGQSAIFS